MNLLSSGFFNIIFVLILYDADPPEPTRAPPRRHAGSCPARQQESRHAMASAAMLVMLS
jgi:hypothetical protein